MDAPIRLVANKWERYLSDFESNLLRNQGGGNPPSNLKDLYSKIPSIVKAVDRSPAAAESLRRIANYYMSQNKEEFRPVKAALDVLRPGLIDKEFTPAAISPFEWIPTHTPSNLLKIWNDASQNETQVNLELMRQLFQDIQIYYQASPASLDPVLNTLFENVSSYLKRTSQWSPQQKTLVHELVDLIDRLNEIRKIASPQAGLVSLATTLVYSPFGKGSQYLWSIVPHQNIPKHNYLKAVYRDLTTVVVLMKQDSAFRDQALQRLDGFFYDVMSQKIDPNGVQLQYTFAKVCAVIHATLPNVFPSNMVSFFTENETVELSTGKVDVNKYKLDLLKAGSTKFEKLQTTMIFSDHFKLLLNHLFRFNPDLSKLTVLNLFECIYIAKEIGNTFIEEHAFELLDLKTQTDQLLIPGDFQAFGKLNTLLKISPSSQLSEFYNKVAHQQGRLFPTLKPLQNGHDLLWINIAIPEGPIFDQWSRFILSLDLSQSPSNYQEVSSLIDAIITVNYHRAKIGQQSDYAPVEKLIVKLLAWKDKREALSCLGLFKDRFPELTQQAGETADIKDDEAEWAKFTEVKPGLERPASSLTLDLTSFGEDFDIERLKVLQNLNIAVIKFKSDCKEVKKVSQLFGARVEFTEKEACIVM
jgi:hypothetical protein